MLFEVVFIGIVTFITYNLFQKRFKYLERMLKIEKESAARLVKEANDRVNVLRKERDEARDKLKEYLNTPTASIKFPSATPTPNNTPNMTPPDSPRQLPPPIQPTD